MPNKPSALRAVWARGKPTVHAVLWLAVRAVSGIVGVGGIVQWRTVVKDGRIVEVMEVAGVEGSRVLFERCLPLHDTVF